MIARRRAFADNRRKPVHLRADRHSYDHIGRIAPVTILAASMTAGLYDEARTVVEIGQITDITVGNQHDVAALAAVAAIGAAVVDVLLATERHGSVAAITCLRMNLDLIYEHANSITERTARCEQLVSGENIDSHDVFCRICRLVALY